MWYFRRRFTDLTFEQQKKLEGLFEQVPGLEKVYWIRWGITEVFDTAEDPEEAKEQLEEYRSLLCEDDVELLEFFQTYDSHQEGILAYFQERKSSGVVEGINNKARVITKRSYGLKNVRTLWQRLCLDLNWAAHAIGHSVKRVKAIVQKIRDTFRGFYI